LSGYGERGGRQTDTGRKVDDRTETANKKGAEKKTTENFPFKYYIL
jgi:hypothetical protein